MADPKENIERGQQHIRMGNLEKALVEFRIAEQFATEPFDIFTAKNNIGIVKVKEKKYDEAREQFKHVVEKFPEQEFGYINLYSVCEESREFGSIEDILSKGIQKIEKNGILRLLLSHYLLYDMKMKKALDVLDATVNDFKVSNPKIAVSAIKKCAMQFMYYPYDKTKEDNEKSNSLLLKLTEIGTEIIDEDENGKVTQEEFDLILLYGHLAENVAKDYKTAAAVYDTSIRLMPEGCDPIRFCIAFTGSARNRMQIGMEQEGLSILEKLENQEPFRSMDSYNYTAAILSYKEGNVEKAVEHFKRIMYSPFDVKTGFSLIDDLSQYYKTQTFEWMGFLCTDEKYKDTFKEVISRLHEVGAPPPILNLLNGYMERMREIKPENFKIELTDKEVNALLGGRSNLMALVQERASENRQNYFKPKDN